MILLTKHSLKPSRKVPLDALSLQLKERDSTATMVPMDKTGIAVDAWLQDDTDPGKGIVWRVVSIKQAYKTDTETVNLEHAINTLKDTILFGEHTTKMIAGNNNAKKCTALQAIQYILSKQEAGCKDWILDESTFAYGSVQNPYKFDGDTLLDALETVSSSLDNCMWSYDFSSYPFKLKITKKVDDVKSELRPLRNLRTITKSIDRSGMYTRFYPIGKDDLKLSDNDGHVDKNTKTYGIVSKVETDQSIETTDELKRWANERLKLHAEPTVTIDVEGMELADATGESMDRFRIGTVCRVPLSDYGTTITERITALSYTDKLHRPEEVKITLANNRNDVAKIISDVIKSGGRSSRNSAKQAKDDHAWFEDTNDHVAMVAEGIIGVDEKGEPNWTRMSEVVVDGEGIHQRVKTVEGDVASYESRFEQNEQSIGMVVGKNDKDQKYIKAGEIVLAINADGTSKALIQATHITLDGETNITNYLSVDKGNLVVNKYALLNSGVTVSGGNLKLLSTASIEINGSAQGSSLTIGYGDIKNAIKSASVSGDTLTLTPFVGEAITFKKATKVSGSWSGKTVSLTAGTTGYSTFTIQVEPKFIQTQNPSKTYVTVYQTSNGAAQPSDVTSARMEIQLGLNAQNTIVQVQDGSGSQIIDSPVLPLNITNRTITGNGTYNAPEGVLGWNKVVVNVPTGYMEPKARFSVAVGQYYIVAKDGDGGNEISGSQVNYQLVVQGTKVQIHDTANPSTRIANTPELTIPLTSRTFTSNGTYNIRSDDYVGWNSVTVNVSGYAEPKAKFSVAVGQYYIVATDGAGGNEIAGSQVNYQLKRAGTKVQIHNTESTSSRIANTPELTIPLTTKSITSNGTYTISSDDYVGWNSVTVNVSGYAEPKAKFSVNSGQYYIIVTNGDGGSEIPGSQTNYQLVRNGTKVQIHNTASTSSRIANTPELTIPLTLKTIYSNGIYNFSGDDYAGWNKVVVDVPTGYMNPKTKFGASSGQYFVTSTDGDGGHEISGSSITYKMALNGTTVQIQKPDGTRIDSTPQLTIPLTTRSITRNGTYNVSGDYLGYSSVTVNVPVGYLNPKTKFGASSGQFYVTSTDGDGGHEITGSSITYKLALNGTTVQMQKPDGTKIPSTATLNLISSLETLETSQNNVTLYPSSEKIGFSKVTINVPTKTLSDVSIGGIQFSTGTPAGIKTFTQLGTITELLKKSRMGYIYFNVTLKNSGSKWYRFNTPT